MLFIIALLLVTVSVIGQEIPAYYKVGYSSGALNNLQSQIKTVLTDAERLNEFSSFNEGLMA